MAISTTSNQTRFWRDRSPCPGRPSSLSPRRTSCKRMFFLTNDHRHRDVSWEHSSGSQDHDQPTLRAEESVTSPRNSGRNSTSTAPKSTMSNQRTDPMDIFEPDPIRYNPTLNLHGEIEHMFGKRTEAKLAHRRPHPLFESLDAMISDNKNQEVASKNRPTFGQKRSISWAHGCSPADQEAEKVTRERANSLPLRSQEPGDMPAAPMAAAPSPRPTFLIGPRSELSRSPPRKWLQLDDNISGPRLVQVRPGPGYDELPPLLYVTADPGVVDSIPPLDPKTQALALDDLRGYVSSSSSSSQASRSPPPEREETIEEDDWETEDEKQVTEDEDYETESELEEVQVVETRKPERMVRLLNGDRITISEYERYKNEREPNRGMGLTIPMMVLLVALFVAYMNLAR
ncbi:hypothetical protein CKAH01_01005 [Colletotrichum kahawae]|uniref:Uncharacterized protein n=1 Tax=Colletotrichum kahawae TaxID=34407 RepID=A0AAD9YK37_COLKA|nr:hypothetical protein CKAH01_01005 [Colletotrichum kahawae]